jgi:hypothetical protein
VSPAGIAERIKKTMASGMIRRIDPIHPSKLAVVGAEVFEHEPERLPKVPAIGTVRAGHSSGMSSSSRSCSPRLQRHRSWPLAGAGRTTAHASHTLLSRS